MYKTRICQWYPLYIYGLSWSCSLQDCLATIPPHPFYNGERDDNYDVAQCFLDRNATSTIPHKYSSRQEDAFEYGCADGAGPNSQRGSNVYEINTWLWNFGRPQPHVGGLSVAKTEKIRRKSRSEASKRGWATKKARTWLPHGICIVYTMYIPGIYCLVVKLDFWVKLSWWPEMPCCLHAFPLPLTSIASLKTGETWTLLIQVYV